MLVVGAAFLRALPVSAEEAPSSGEASDGASTLSLPAETPEDALEAPRRPPPPPPDDVAPPAVTHRSEEAVDAGAKSPRAPAGARVHDGFYLRFAIGANYGRSFVQTNRISRPDVRIVGMGRAFNLWLGTTVPNGITLGLNLTAADVSSDAADIGADDEAAARSWAFQLGGFLDTHPNPREGYHFGGAVSLAAMTAHTDPIPSDYLGAGLGMCVFAGYDAWVAPQLSIGGLLRLGGTVTRQSTEEGGLDVTKQGTAYGAQLLATILYH